MHIGTRVLEWRERRGWSQRKAAREAGISQAAWSSLESGEGKRIGLQVAARIVALLDGVIALTDLVEDDNVRRLLLRRSSKRSTSAQPSKAA